MTKKEHWDRLQKLPKLVEVPEGSEEPGTDAWFHFDYLWEE